MTLQYDLQYIKVSISEESKQIILAQVTFTYSIEVESRLNQEKDMRKEVNRAYYAQHSEGLQRKQKQNYAKNTFMSKKSSTKQKKDNTENLKGNFQPESRVETLSDFQVKVQHLYVLPVIDICMQKLFRDSIKKNYNSNLVETINYFDGTTFICKTCHLTFKKEKLPMQAVLNKLEILEAPEVIRKCE